MSERLTIYRVEHQTSQYMGPFSPLNPGRDALSAYHENMLEAHVDCKGFTSEHLCGCDSLEKVRYWFGPFFSQLEESGFVVMQYQLLRRNVLESETGTQLAFYPYSATPKQPVAWGIAWAAGSKSPQIMSNKIGKIKAIIWVCATPLVVVLGAIIALVEYDYALGSYLHNARAFWYDGDYCDEQGRVFDKNNEQIYPPKP